MSSLEKLKKTSHLVRMIIFSILIVLFVIAFYGYIVKGEWWVTLGDGQFNQLWEVLPDARTLLGIIIGPFILTLLAAIYWLQRLLLELSRGLFFSRKCMHCLKWLAWLSLFSVLYNMLWPLLASALIETQHDIALNIRPLSLLVILCLPVLVHLLSAARELDQENKEII
jgi:nitrate reductase NapE component